MPFKGSSLLMILLAAIFLLPDTVKASSKHHFKINGFLDMEYEKSYSFSESNALLDKSGSFDQVHFNLLMEFPVTTRLTVKGHLEYEHSPQLPAYGKINLEWAYFEYLLNNSVRLRGGTVLTPFGLYNEIHDATPTYLSVQIPWEIYKAYKVGGFSMFPKFSTGVNLVGDYLTEGDFGLEYVIYVVNGENDTENPAEKDENGNKAIGGRILISPGPDFKLGGSAYTGKAGVAKKDHTTWAGSVEFRRSYFMVQAEYASSKLADITATGWYGEVSYRVNKITPFIRYGELDPDGDISRNEWTELVYGINYEIYPQFIFKLENRHFGGNANNAVVKSDYKEVAAAISVAF